MAVSAIHTAGLQPAALPEAKNHQSSISMRLDFAAMLAAFDDPGASDSVLPASTFRAEAFRSSTLAGHTRLTTIVFGDGTSETRLDEMGADSISAPLPRLIPNVTMPFDIPLSPSATRRKIIGGRGRGIDLDMGDGHRPAAAPRRLASITADTPGRVIDLFA